MPPTVTLSLLAEDAEPILRAAAYRAAYHSALLDHMTARTVDCPGPGDFREARKAWNAQFFAAKRIVEAFGVEYEQTSEAETLTVYYDLKPGKVAQPDYSKAYPRHAREVHNEACRQAAARVVRKWREGL